MHRARWIAFGACPATRLRRVADVRREEVEAFLVERQDAGMRPATLSQRFRSLQQFFKWLTAEGELDGSPMATRRPPLVPETPTGVAGGRLAEAAGRLRRDGTSKIAGTTR